MKSPAKYSMATLILSATISTLMAAAATSATRPLVFILAGQSNMDGRAGFQKGESREIPPGVHLYVNGVATDQYRSGANSNWFGPEVAFARAVRAAVPEREIILIKRAKGGTSLAFWTTDRMAEGVKTGEHGERTGPWFNLLLDDVRKALGDREVEIGAVLWMQGENDCRTEKDASNYCAGLAKLVAAFRKELGVADLPFIFGQVNPPMDGPKPHPFADITRAGQEKYEKEDLRSFRVLTDDISKASDRLHYDHDGQLELGKRFAEAWLDLNKNRAL